MPYSYPDTLPVEHLEAQHAGYDPKLVQTHHDLYYGGHAFRRNIEEYLDRRECEESGTTITDTTGNLISSRRSDRDRRKDVSRYIPTVSGKIDFLVAAIFQAEPRIVPQADESDYWAPRDGSDYWAKLNENCNGREEDLTAVAWALALDLMLHRQAFLSLRYPISAEGSQEQLKRDGALDILWDRIPAEEVHDWSEGYIKRVRDVEWRENPWDAETKSRKEFTFVDAEQVVTYTAERDENGNLPDNATLTSETQHSFGAMPVVRIYVPSDLWIMDRLREPALGKYNRESSLTWYLNQCAYSLLTITSAKSVAQIQDPDTGALAMEVGDDAKFVSPPTATFDSLRQDIERQDKALDDAIQAAALSAARRDTQGRQSGKAKYREYGALATLLSSYAKALRDGIETAVKRVKTARDDQFAVQLAGLDNVDPQSMELKIKSAKEMLALDLTPTARGAIILETELAYLRDQPIEVLQQIIVESKARHERLANPPAPPANKRTVTMRRDANEQIIGADVEDVNE